MKRSSAWLVIGGLLAWSLVALVAPWPVAGMLTLVAYGAAIRVRALTWFLALTFTFHVLLMGILVESNAVLWSWKFLQFSTNSLALALAVTLRLGAILGASAAVQQWIGLPRLIEGLQLGPRATAFIAALWVAINDLGRDAERIAETQRSIHGRLNLRRSIQVLGAMVAAAIQRARTRHDALALAGIRAGPQFATIVAFTALAAVSRMAFIAIPNVAPTFLFVFLAGWIGGFRVGITTGALAMLATDLLISGFLPIGLVNIPAMAMVGAAGAGLARARDGDHAILLAAVGILVTLGWSILADSTEWLIVSELRTTPGAWSARVAAGLAFNVPAAIVNGAMFALALRPLTRTWRQFHDY